MPVRTVFGPLQADDRLAAGVSAPSNLVEYKRVCDAV